MKQISKSTIILAAGAVFWLVSGSIYLIAAEKGREAVSSELTKSVGMPILTGETWQKMDHETKVAFLWGFWHSVAIDNYLSDKYPELDKDDFSSKVMEASEKSPKTLNQDVADIDDYYQKNPDQLQKPVIAVFWDKEIKPNITTGIAGRPLKAKE